LTRDDLKRLLARAVRERAITEREAAEILAAFDAGTLDTERLPSELTRDGDLAAATAGAAVALALVLLARTRTARRERGWTYDPEARRYRTPAGRTVTPERVRQQIDRVLDRAAVPMRQVSERLAARRISLADWYRQMEEMIAARHVAAAAAARGGIAQLTDADREWIRDRIEEQFRYLDRFGADIQSGRQPLDGRYRARVALYAEAARGTYEDMRRRVAAQSGYTEERSVLGAADHCSRTTRPGCIEEARRGWQPIGTISTPGKRTCLARCRCVLRYRREGEREAAA
jgi:hypothetical protein